MGYNVGPGHHFANGKLSFKKQGDTGLREIQPFSPRTKERGTVLESTRPTTAILSCSQTGCVLTFKTQAKADAHTDSGHYVRELESECDYNTIKNKWAEKMFDVSVASREEETSPACHDRPSSSNMEEHRPKVYLEH